MRIASLAPINDKKQRVIFENAETIILYNKEIKAFAITLDGEISEETYEAILHDVLNKRTRNRALYLLQKHTYTEMRLR